MAIVNEPLLAGLRTGFSTVFQEAYGKALSQWGTVATHVASSDASTTYGWLGQFPRLNKWVGDRTLQNMKEHAYTIVNDKFEGTVLVPLDAIEDDSLGVYKPMFAEMGYAAATHPDELVFALLRDGHTGLCYDKKPFFAANHPVYAKADGTGAATNVSNLLAPSADPGPAWYLLDVSRPLKPFIFQERTPPQLQVITSAENETVFMKDSVPYGIRYRCNAGYGFWQQAVKSTCALTPDAFKDALEAMQSLKADGGRPLGIGYGGETGTLLVVPSTLQAAARSILAAEKDAAGASNIWFKAATLLVSPWV